MKVFVDTWAWYALADVADTDHEAARRANDELLDSDATFVTSNFVIAETTTLIRYRLGHQAAIQFRQTLKELIDLGLVELVQIDNELEAKAESIFEKFDDQDFSFVDCTSFAVMQSRELTSAFTGDKHFATMGFLLKP